MLARFILVVSFGLMLSLNDALADKRVALVIGNSAYKSAPRLANPENDAGAVGLLFKEAGFDSVDVRVNLSNADMRRLTRDFSETSKDADIAVVFFAGHGIEVGGINYLIPVDSALKRDIDVEDEAISLDRVVALLEPARRLRLVILDACRDNPFTATMTRTLANRSVGRGLAKIETTSSDTLVAYAAKAGSIASDGQGSNSPFTLALLKHLTTPGLDVRLAFGRIRDEVLVATSRKQEPFVYGALGGATVSLAALSTSERDASQEPKPGDDSAQASKDYEFAAKVATREAWESFLKKHPIGFYADLANSNLAKMKQGKADSAGEEKPARPAIPPTEKKKTASTPNRKSGALWDPPNGYCYVAGRNLRRGPANGDVNGYQIALGTYRKSCGQDPH